jgi:hypothetical protein
MHIAPTPCHSLLGLVYHHQLASVSVTGPTTATLNFQPVVHIVFKTVLAFNSKFASLLKTLLLL